jgi:GTP-binding protein
VPPVVVIVGRPNVGKSTLFNRLAGRRAAMVADTPGVTRDWREADARLRGRMVRLVDTAGLEDAADETLPGRMRVASAAVIAEAALVVMLIDAREGVTAADEQVAGWLRRQGRPVLLVANKAEGRAANSAVLDAYALGLGDPLAVSAEHGEGIADLMAEIAEWLPNDGEEQETTIPRALRLSIVGRPNVGKSTLLNRLLGEARMVTGPEPGLTRESITVRLQDEEGELELVDTAGLRRRARIETPLERLSARSTIEAIRMAEVVVLTMDATVGVHDQDLQIARLVEREGRAAIVACNKWDAVADRNTARQAIVERLNTSLAQMKGVEIVTLSALTGHGVERLLPAVRRAHALWNTRVPTGELNRWFESALNRHPPPLVGGRRPKLRYITQAKRRPPTFVAFGARANRVPDEYQRYLVNSLRETFALPGTPIRLQLRETA